MIPSSTNRKKLGGTRDTILQNAGQVQKSVEAQAVAREQHVRSSRKLSSTTGRPSTDTVLVPDSETEGEAPRVQNKQRDTQDLGAAERPVPQLPPLPSTPAKPPLHRHLDPSALNVWGLGPRALQAHESVECKLAERHSFQRVSQATQLLTALAKQMAIESGSDTDTNQPLDEGVGLGFEWPLHDLHQAHFPTSVGSSQDQEPKTEALKPASTSCSSERLEYPLHCSAGSTIPEGKPWPHSASGSTTPGMLELPACEASRGEQAYARLTTVDAEFLTGLEWVNDALLPLEGPLSPAAPSSPDLGTTCSLPSSGYTTPSL